VINQWLPNPSVHMIGATSVRYLDRFRRSDCLRAMNRSLRGDREWAERFVVTDSRSSGFINSIHRRINIPMRLTATIINTNPSIGRLVIILDSVGLGL